MGARNLAAPTVALEVAPREVREHRRDACAGLDIVDRVAAAVVARRDGQPAPAEAQVEEPDDVTAVFRDEITARGVVLEDTPTGTRWKVSG